MLILDDHLLSRLGSAEDGGVGVGHLVQGLGDGPRLQLQAGALCSLLCRHTHTERHTHAHTGTAVTARPASAVRNEQKGHSGATFRRFPEVRRSAAGRGVPVASRPWTPAPSSVAGAAAGSTPPAHVVVVSVSCAGRDDSGESASQ